MKKNNRRGFTIVELVIVIAVIAILAGVLIPTFAGIISKANQSKALQEAQNAYKEAYALAIADGKIDSPEAQEAGSYEFTFTGTIDKLTEVTVKVLNGSDAANDKYVVSVSASGVVTVNKADADNTTFEKETEATEATQGTN